MNRQVTGRFEVQLTAAAADERAPAAFLGRLAIDKQFHGALEAVSVGQMLSVRTEVEGSAAYVALEQVSGTLEGSSGSFVLQHVATMERGAPELTIAVVPDSGTGELTGLRGSMRIERPDGNHAYVFDFELPEGRT